MTRVGVVGHVEWVQFARVPRVPLAGEIVHASEFFSVPGGGGGVAAVQLRRLAGSVVFLTALGTGAEGEQALAQLRDDYGVTIHAAARPGPQRRAFTYVDDDAERTITVLGDRIVPVGADQLPWESLGELDAVYFTGGDAGAVRAARAARVLVATARALEPLAAAGARVDVLVGSASDPGESYEAGMLDPEPLAVVRTRGSEGGSWELGELGARAPWLPDGVGGGDWPAAPLPAAPVDAYGCGDSFAAGLTYGLGTGMALEAAIELGARCGATCLTGRGPYGAPAHA